MRISKEAFSMTIRELIKQLSKFDQELEVKSSDYDGFFHSEIDSAYLMEPRVGFFGPGYVVITVGRN